MALCMAGAIAVLGTAWRWQHSAMSWASGLERNILSQAAGATTLLVVDLSDRQVYVYQQNANTRTLKASYKIAIGQKGWETPIGNYQILAMQKYPAWQHPITGAVVPPGSANPLGARWIQFTTSNFLEIGFHGTEQTETIGSAASHGCVRMRNQDIIQLYDQVSLGTPVTVQP
jgi:lipoprotein-anchoring transpeptidase ErfK/SrfK